MDIHLTISSSLCATIVKCFIRVQNEKLYFQSITHSRSIEISVISRQSSICKLARSTTKVPPGVPRGVCLLNFSKYQNDSCRCLFKC
ncbi:hypothetical protein CFP56_033408 [Quercus suber]|uniref:Uncharacterized protein n=1 Tax=Quercus suber TaxID=58331 RepID=A0AAW0LU63_QUESU